MENLGRNDQNYNPKQKSIVTPKFEQNAKVRIHKGKENYNGGSGYYAPIKKGDSPNVCDD